MDRRTFLGILRNLPGGFLLSASAVSLSVALPKRAQAEWMMARLSPQTVAEFDRYVKDAEAKMDWRPRLQPSADGSIVYGSGVSGAGARRDSAEPAGTKQEIARQSTVDVTDGMIHDWVAAVIAPGAQLDDVVKLLQNYDDYKSYYAPDVSESKLLDVDGNRRQVFLKLYRKKILTTRFNTEYEVNYGRPTDHRWTLQSRSTRIAEVSDGKELPPGTGHGFLWRLNSYWILEQRPAGVYMECRAITLTRDVPAGLAWAIKPMLTSVPMESLSQTLGMTVRALRR